MAIPQSRIDRAAERRGDPARSQRSTNDPRAGAYVIGGEMVVLKKPARCTIRCSRWPRRARWRSTRGRLSRPASTTPRASRLRLDAATVEAAEGARRFHVTDLRSIAVQGLVDADHLPPLAEGKALLNWHARHRFCPNCGAADAGRSKPAGGAIAAPARAEHFPRTDPVVIMLAVEGERCLLGPLAPLRAGMWSCLAGFVEPGETIEDAVRREMLRGSRHRLRPRRLFRLAAVAVPDLADDRLPCRGAHARHRRRPQRTRRRALVRPRGSWRDAGAAASGGPDHAAADGHRLSHHPRLGGGRRWLR